MQLIRVSVLQVQGLMGPSRFTKATAALPQDTLLLEIGPHAVLQSLLHQNCPSHQCFSIMRKGCNAAEMVRECAAELWRKGAPLKWALLQETVRKAAELPRDVRDALVSWDHSVEHKASGFALHSQSNSRCVSPEKAIPSAKQGAPEEGPAAPETPERADHSWARSDSSASELSECRSRPPSPREGAAAHTGQLLPSGGRLAHPAARAPPPSLAACASSGSSVRDLPPSSFATYEPEVDPEGGCGISRLSAERFHALGKPVTADSASSLDFQRLELAAGLSKPVRGPKPTLLEDAWFPDLSADMELASDTGLFTKMMLQQAVSVVLLLVVLVTAAASLAQLLAHVSVPARLIWKALLILLTVVTLSALNMVGKARLQQDPRLQQDARSRQPRGHSTWQRSHGRHSQQACMAVGTAHSL